jgi:hypothetical protein
MLFVNVLQDHCVDEVQADHAAYVVVVGPVHQLEALLCSLLGYDVVKVDSPAA